MNEDYSDYLWSEDGWGCWAVADGLGGHGGGNQASRVAVTTALETFQRKPGCESEDVRHYIEEANRAILRVQQDEGQITGMRSTLVLLVTDGARACWGHVGDTRLYRFTGGRVTFQTEDHSVPQALVNAGEITRDEIRFHEDRNRLLRSLGANGSARPEVLESPAELTGDDAFLLCTDGFWEHITEAQMEQDYADSGDADEWLRRMCDRVKRNSGKDSDNFTAIVARRVS